MSDYNSRHTGAEIDEAIDKATKVVANPTLAGTESNLSGVEIAGTKYKVAAEITIDSTISDSSENPIQNKVITSALSGKQNTLVSGINIKTLNNQSILGNGNINISSVLKDRACLIDSGFICDSTKTVVYDFEHSNSDNFPIYGMLFDTNGNCYNSHFQKVNKFYVNYSMLREIYYKACEAADWLYTNLLGYRAVGIHGHNVYCYLDAASLNINSWIENDPPEPQSLLYFNGSEGDADVTACFLNSSYSINYGNPTYITLDQSDLLAPKFYQPFAYVQGYHFDGSSSYTQEYEYIVPVDFPEEYLLSIKETHWSPQEHYSPDSDQ